MNLGKNLMLDTWDGQIWYPRFYDIDTILSYDNSGEIKFDVDIEMEQGYWNTSSSRLWTKIRDLMHDELVEVYKDMRANGVTYEDIMHYMYDEQIARIPQSYFNQDYDIKYAPYADEYLGKAHGDGYQHMKRWLKKRFIFCDTLYDYAPSYNNDVLTIRANTLNEMNLTIETYTPLYQHVSFYNGNMEKIKITPGQPMTFKGFAQTETDQEVLIYGGSNIKKITGIQSMNPNSMLIGGATRLTELDISNCPILTIVNSNKANFSPHTYLNKLNMSNCPQLGGNLNVSNSPLLQEINAKGSGITGLLMPTSLRNLKTLRLPNTLRKLTLHDIPLLNTLEFDKGVNLQSISLTNCNHLNNCINFDLTQVPTVLLDNSYNSEELYMSATTNLTLRNMPTLKRVIFTPNSEYSEFDLNNVIGGKNYKVTANGCPKLKTFMTTAPHRYSYSGEYKQFIEASEKVYTVSDMTENNHINWQTGADLENYNYCRLPYTKVYVGATIKIESTHIDRDDPSCWVILYDNNKAYRGAFSYNKGNGAYNTTNGEAVVLEDGYMRIRMYDTDTDGKVYYTRQSETIMTKDITPNTAFTANTLDLSATQFTDIKLLCTTDVYNLKVPTTLKNFYCDSAMDIDTDVIEDASYEVIHEELIEPYTTNYEGEVCRYEEVIISETFSTLGTQGKMLNGGDSENGISDSARFCLIDYMPVKPGSTITFSGYNETRVKCYDKDYNYIPGSHKDYFSSDYIVPNNAYYFRAHMWTGGYLDGALITFESYKSHIPNIIPSSANGSLIFNMYSNNTTQPTSTSPYMWDLTGLKLNDFYTYGMNNWVKPSEDSYVKNSTTQLYGAIGRYSGNTFRQMDTSDRRCLSISPILVAEDVVRIKITTSSKTSIYHYNSDDYDRSTGTVTTQNFPGGMTSGGTWTGNTAYPIGAGKNAIRLISFYDYTRVEWFDITTEDINGVESTTRFYMKDIPIVTASEFGEKPIIEEFTYSSELAEIKSITMPQRMPGYSVRLVNADITPDEYPTMLYPKLIDTTLPITGKLDYTKYNGNSLAWAYAYTTGDVTINPPSNISTSLDLSTCISLEETYVHQIINNLATVESATLTLGETYLAYLTEEEIEAAVNKGWTLE